MRPRPTFDYVLTAGCEPCHRHAPTKSHRQSDEVREIAHLEGNGWSLEGNRDRSMGVVGPHTSRATPGRLAKSATASMLYATHSYCTVWFEE